MDTLTIRLPTETLEDISDEAERRGLSKSEVIRERLNENAELRAECDRLQTECDRLRNEKRLILEQREETAELVEYVEDELSYREAGLGTRLKWWMFGKG